MNTTTTMTMVVPIPMYMDASPARADLSASHVAGVPSLARL
jgi:hypothetical protein